MDAVAVNQPVSDGGAGNVYPLVRPGRGDIAVGDDDGAPLHGRQDNLFYQLAAGGVEQKEFGYWVQLAVLFVQQAADGFAAGGGAGFADGDDFGVRRLLLQAFGQSRRGCSDLPVPSIPSRAMRWLWWRS